MLDSDVLIDVLRGFPPALIWLSAHKTQQFVVPGFVILELIQGCQDKTQLSRLQAFLRPFQRFWPDAEICEKAVQTLATYHLSHSLGVIDALIAESAIALGIPLCTFNEKHYSAVPGLLLEKPYSRTGP